MKRRLAGLTMSVALTALSPVAHAENFTFDLSGPAYVEIFGLGASIGDENLSGEIIGLSASGASSATDVQVLDPLQGILDLGSGGSFTVANNAISAASFTGSGSSSSLSGGTLTLADASGSYDAGVFIYGYGIDNGRVTYAPASAAPEPSTWLLMFAGIGGIGLMLRRTKKTMGFQFKNALAA